MSRHRTRLPAMEEESSSDDDDGGVFASLSLKTNGESRKRSNPSTTTTTTASTAKQHPTNKRHYGSSSARKTKMESVLEELQMSKPVELDKDRHRHHHPSNTTNRLTGSFVEPEQEHTTTNIFVGNLPPTINESILYEFFSRFGPLHSVKIMWPRDPQHGGAGVSSSHNSINGFVCFQERPAAEDAFRHCRFELCFGGRQLRTGWGKPIRTPPPPPPTSMTSQHHHLPSQEQDPQQHRTNTTTATTVTQLTPHELNDYRRIIQQELLAPARHRICTAMAFCFDKSRAARHICRLLQDDITSTTPLPVDTIVAHLYLLSDILYNSQQPGIRNAFVYRDAIQDMCPVVFAHWRDVALGRLSRDRLSQAVSAVLATWTNWGVYDATFLDTLDDTYKGRERKGGQEQKVTPKISLAVATSVSRTIHHQQESPPPIDKDRSSRPDSMTLNNSARDLVQPIPSEPNELQVSPSFGNKLSTRDGTNDDDDDGIPLSDDDIDGLPLEEGDYFAENCVFQQQASRLQPPSGGRPIIPDDQATVNKESEIVDGKPLDNDDDYDDIDGEPLEDDCDIDGEPLCSEDDTAGAPL